VAGELLFCFGGQCDIALNLDTVPIRQGQVANSWISLVAIENFTGDPEDILIDAEIRMSGEISKGAGDTLQNLKKHYLDEPLA